MRTKSIILFSFLIIGLIITSYGLIGGSGAWFTDTATMNGTISSGNFDLMVSGGPFNLSKIEPGAGYLQVGEFCIMNAGNYNMKFRGKLKDVNDPGNLRSFLMIKIEMIAYSSENNPHEITYGPTDGKVLAEDVPFTSLMDWNDAIALYPGGPDNPIAFFPGAKSCYTISAKLTNAAGNDQILQTVTSNLYIDATQWINTGW